ncbi:MAG TPA: hypothetical protein VLF63_02790 [Patescibacteria group bacterium]|nr:hypothetical protein [Patescibacteria group bacterium]
MTVERPQPYIGISGVAHIDQHIALFDVALRERIDNMGYFMMIGVQATGKTQIHDIENKRGQMWHPVGEEIADAAASEDSGLTKPFVHCFFDGQSELVPGITNVMDRTRHYIRGLQINGLAWMEEDYNPIFSAYKDRYPDQSIILQAGSIILNNYSPKVVAEKLKDMPADYVLLDHSGGMGKELEVERIRGYVDEVYQQQIPIGVAVSGGLEAGNVEELFGPLAEMYPNLSCDAEGRLRKGSVGSTTLDLELAEDFIMAWKQSVSISESSTQPL